MLAQTTRGTCGCAQCSGTVDLMSLDLAARISFRSAHTSSKELRSSKLNTRRKMSPIEEKTKHKFFFKTEFYTLRIQFHIQNLYSYSTNTYRHFFKLFIFSRTEIITEKIHTSEDRQPPLGWEVPFPGCIQDVNLVGLPTDAKQFP